MPDPDNTPPATEKSTDELERALKRAAQPRTEEPQIAADDGGASAPAEEDGKAKAP